METNCNQMSALQRNDRVYGNVNCNCNMNSNAAMRNRGCNQRCERRENRSCERDEKMKCERRENRSCERNERPECERNEGSNSSPKREKQESRGCNRGHGEVQTIRDEKGRSMEVECVCKVKTEKTCHKEDPMEKLGGRFPIAMAYVPWQQWGELYDAEYGLMQGTIFKDLNKIFCGVRC